MKIGQYNDMLALEPAPGGMFLGLPGEDARAFLPAREQPDDLLAGDKLRVFLYKDSEGNVLATRQTPKAVCGSFAYLRVSEVTPVGAFLDWGLPKELLLPFSEQTRKVNQGEWQLVYVYLDEASQRPVASARLHRFLESGPPTLRSGQEVDLIVEKPTDLGINVIVEEKYRGLLFRSDITRPLQEGDRIKGFVKKIKEEDKIDISLEPPGYARVSPQAEKILNLLEEKRGFLPLNDKSDPGLIFEQLHMSKKTFKKAIGALYKQRRIRMEKDGIYLL